MPDEKERHAFEDARSDRPASAAPTDSELREKHDPYAAFRFTNFRFYIAGNFISVVGRQMLNVAVGWEVYRRTNSATALGLVGLVVALPVILLAIPAGQAADRFSRRLILLVTQAMSALASIGLAALSANYARIPPLPALVTGQNFLIWLTSVVEQSAVVHFDPAIPLMLALLFVSGVARTFGWAARAAFVPNLVSTSAFANAITWNSTTFEIGTVTGPAIGGLLVAKLGFPLVYALDAVSALIFFALLLPIRTTATKLHSDKPLGLTALFSGLRFVWGTKIVLATITLDLFAVLLGGATALLPIFADRILHVGPIGLGWLRAAPSIGAFLMGASLAHLPPMQKAGRTLLFAVAGFGVATIIFGVSKSFWLSMGALLAVGACDNISVVVRHTLVQLLTPDAMRGRVSAVNNVFIGSSNELGAFESGMTAAFFGPVISVVGGGIGTILVVLLVLWIWPGVRKLGGFASIQTATE
jgi:MFS family permease